MRKKIGIPDFEIPDGYIPTGSTLLNLAICENPYGGYPVGTIANIIGDTHAGKTFLLWQGLAEMCYDDRFDGYDLYYNDAELAFRHDVKKLFGKKTEDRVSFGEEERRTLVEACMIRIKKLLAKEIPMVYGLDSLDSIKSRREREKPEKDIGKPEIPDKPRILSQQLPMIAEMLEGTESILIVISQTRDKIGVVFGSKKDRAGGKALEFYSSVIMWLAVKEHIKPKGRDIGIVAKVKVSKSKVTGKQRVVEFPILVNYGIDDIGSMIDWMVTEQFWSKVKGGQIIKTHGDFQDGKRDQVIKYIEQKEYEDDLKNIVGKKWMEIERSLETKRKARYE